MKNTSKHNISYTNQLRENLFNSLLEKRGEYENLETGIVANLSKKSIGKMASAKAIEKSKQNGFSVSEHFEIAENVIELYQKSTLLSSSPTKYENDISTLSIKRFSTNTVLKSGKSAKVLITVKETIQSGHRIYSVEALQLE